MKPIFSFSNYRELLRDYYEAAKRRKGGYSYAAFAKAARLRSANYLALVIQGKRNLTIANIHAFAGAMKLGERDRVFFETLVLRDQATTRAESSFYDRRLKRFQASDGRVRVTSHAPVFSAWFDLGVLVGASGHDRESGIRFLSEKLELGRRDIERTLRRFEKIGLLRYVDDRAEIRFDHIVFEDRKSSDPRHRRYLRDQLDRSARAFDRGYGDGARFLSHTFTIRKATLSAITDSLQSFAERLAARADRDAPDEIVQLNMQLFPAALGNGARPSIAPATD